MILLNLFILKNLIKSIIPDYYDSVEKPARTDYRRTGQNWKQAVAEAQKV